MRSGFKRPEDDESSCSGVPDLDRHQVDVIAEELMRPYLYSIQLLLPRPLGHGTPPFYSIPIIIKAPLSSGEALRLHRQGMNQLHHA